METLKITDVAEILNGYQVREKTDLGKEGNVNFIQVKDLDRVNNKVSFKKLEKLIIEKDMSKYQVKPGDVLFLAKGNIQASLINKDSFKSDEMYVPMSHFYTLRPNKNKVLTEYLWWILNHKETQQSISRQLRGSMMPFLGRVELENLVISVPSLEVQRFIVEFVELRMKEKEMIHRLEESKDKLYGQLMDGVLKGKYETPSFMKELKKL